MDIFSIGVWIVTAGFLVFSFLKDRVRTKKAFQMAFGMGRSLILSILAIVLLIGLVLAILPPGQIAQFVERQNVLLATVAAALFGTITLIPAFIAFPLVGTLVEAGVGIVPSVAFLTTLTMVGIVTFPLERKEFGAKFAFTRNALSLVFAILIAFAMGVVL